MRAKHIPVVFLLYLAQTLSGNERDHLALLDFKSKISHDPQGAFSSWNNSLEICNWEGIICSHRHRRVTTIDLSSKGLVGTLSPYMGNLSFLHKIILSNNTLHGAIPQELGRLSRLQVLDLATNNLGSVEHGDLNFLQSLTNCTTLKKLELGANNLGGSLPHLIGNLSTELTWINFAGNHISGSIPYEICGFGSVYKGIFGRQYLRSALWYNGLLDRDGAIVAVKVFNHKRKRTFDSFITECEALRNIRHRNLVKIITTCSSVDREGNDFRAILYEFMEYGSLGRWLHSTQEAHFVGLDKPHILNIHARINIAIDVASALSYLHHQCGDPRIHCDIKPSNILLDKDMVAHLADFGLAQFLPELPKPDRSSLVRLPGTAGYIPPEYGLGSLVSTEGDVYSYGILLLEMLTGKKPTDRMFHGGLNLHTFSWMALPDRVKDITDPVILRESANGEDGNQMEKCLTKMFTVGVSCSMTSPHVRPNMNVVIRELESVRSMFK